MTAQGQAWLFYLRSMTPEPAMQIIYEPFVGCDGIIATGTKKNRELRRYKISAADARLPFDTLKRLFPAPQGTDE